MIYELRTYIAAPGKIRPLLARFRDHTARLFDRHGLQSIGYWTSAAGEEHMLTYLLAFKDEQDKDRAWAAFRADPDWESARKASEVDGKLTASVTSRLLTPTDFSKLK